MKRWLTLLLLAVAAALAPVDAEASDAAIVVRYVGSVDDPAARLADDLRAVGYSRYADGATPLLHYAASRTNPLRAVATVEVAGRDSARVIDALLDLTNVLFVERDATVRAFFTPNDPQFAAQWHWPKISAETAWDYDVSEPLYGGDPTVTVAVLDTGVAYETYNDNGTQYAQSPDFGATAFAEPYDFVNNDAHANDDNGHGTHVAGTIAEATNNAVGGAGLAFNTTIMPLKVLNRQGVGSMADVAAAVSYAVDHGADVVNLSLGTNTPTQTLQTSVTAALAASVVVVAATGNDGASTISYPAAYDGVIAVSAVGEDDLLATYSNYGLGVTLAAPGGDGTSYIWQMGYGNLDSNNLPADYTSFELVGYQGTSQATPQVAAAAALLLARGATPGSGIKSLLENTATDLAGAGYDTQTGWGMLNIAGALAAYSSDATAPVSSASVSPESPDGNEGYYKTKPAVTLAATDVGSGVGAVRYYWNSGTALTYTVPLTPPEGTNTLVFYAQDVSGNVEAAQSLTLTVDSEGPTVTLTEPSASFQPDGTVSVSGTVLDERSGFSSLTIDGTALTVDDAGAFSTTATYPFRTRPTLTLVATDRAGATRTLTKSLNLGTRERIVIGAGRGKGPLVRFYTNTKRLVSSFFGFARTMRSGINVAQGDFDADNTDEIVVAPRNAGPQVRLLASNGDLLRQFFAYRTSFHGGVRLATGLLDDTGARSIVTAPGPGLRPQIRTFDGTGTRTAKFDAYATEFLGGVMVSVGDVRGDDAEEIVTTPGSVGSPDLRIYSGSGTLLKRFFAFERSYRGGVMTATCDLTGDEREEIVAVPSGVRAPLVRVFASSGTLKKEFRPFPASSTAGLTVACGDINGNGTNEILIGEREEGGNLKAFSFAGRLLYRYTDLPTSSDGFSLATAFID